MYVRIYCITGLKLTRIRYQQPIVASSIMTKFDSTNMMLPVYIGNYRAGNGAGKAQIHCNCKSRLISARKKRRQTRKLNDEDPIVQAADPMLVMV
jgi:hypothetical protein